MNLADISQTLAETKQVVVADKDFISAVTPLVTLLLALVGLDAWQRQMRGKDKYELTRRILIRTYNIRESIKVLVPPHLSLAQYSPNESDEEYTPRAIEELYKMFDEPYKVLNKLLNELDADLIEAQIFYSEPKLRKCFSKLRQIREIMKTEIDEFLSCVCISYCLRGDTDIRELRRNFRDYGRLLLEAVKPITSAELDLAIEHIEDYLKPHLVEAHIGLWFRVQQLGKFLHGKSHKLIRALPFTN